MFSIKLKCHQENAEKVKGSKIIRNITEIKACKKPIELNEIKNELPKLNVLECLPLNINIEQIMLNYADFNSFT